MDISRLCLGTAQFGMKYGINNQTGRQPFTDEVMQMMDAAVSKGIRVFDTAAGYGNSEILLGDYVRSRQISDHEISFISKFPPERITDDIKNISDFIRKELELSLVRLGVSKLKGYLLHDASDLYRKGVLEAMAKLKEDGLAEQTGVSVYDIKDADAAIDSGYIDYIQMPFSIFDQRGEKEGLFKRAEDKNVTVFVRSVFLQGLLLMDESRIPEYLHKAKGNLEKLDVILNKYHYSRFEAAIGFVKKCQQVSCLVFGADTADQLEEFINTYHKIDLSEECVREIKKIYVSDRDIIYPYLWGK